MGLVAAARPVGVGGVVSGRIRMQKVGVEIEGTENVTAWRGGYRPFDISVGNLTALAHPFG